MRSGELSEVPSTTGLFVSEFDIEQVFQILRANAKFEHTVDGTSDRASRLAFGVDGNSTTDIGVVVTRPVIDHSEINRREKEIGMLQDFAATGLNGFLADALQLFFRCGATSPKSKASTAATSGEC